MRKGTVYLIGAGPGDPGLLTLKGKRLLAQADAVIYDRLVNPRLLEYARADAEIIYAGKGAQAHVLSQAEINALLIARAAAGQTVARLKGGDPFLFGRGGEEAAALRAAGIPFVVVPGVSSALAVPAYAGIPVTHRDFTSTVGIITGHEDPTKGATAIDWAKIATGCGTLVLLMGMENLAQICQQLLAHGRAATTPVAVIRWGTWPQQVVLSGELGTIAAQVAATGLTAPAIIVVGEVAGLRQQLQWFETLPLAGRRIVVTRPQAQAGALTTVLEDRGAAVLEFPVIKIVPPADWTPVDRAIQGLHTYHWVVFTSVNGVEAFCGRLFRRGGDARCLARTMIGALGPQTAAALTRWGLRADYLPDEFCVEALAQGLAKRVRPGDRVLLPRAAAVPPTLQTALAACGASVTACAVYRTVPDCRGLDVVLAALQRQEVDVVTFTSASTVRHFLAAIGEENYHLLQQVCLACIGPVTAQTVREYGFRPQVIAAQYTIEGLVAALTAYYAPAHAAH